MNTTMHEQRNGPNMLAAVAIIGVATLSAIGTLVTVYSHFIGAV